MRKVLLIAAIVLEMSAAAQSISRISGIQMGVFDVKHRQWIWEDEQPIDLTFTLTNRAVVVNDKAHSVYVITGGEKAHEDDEVAWTGWDVVDAQDRKCYFKMVYIKNTNRTFFYVMYNGVAYCYRVSKL